MGDGRQTTENLVVVKTLPTNTGHESQTVVQHWIHVWRLLEIANRGTNACVLMAVFLYTSAAQN